MYTARLEDDVERKRERLYPPVSKEGSSENWMARLIDLSANLATTWSGKKMELSIISPTRSMGPDF